MKIDFEIVRPIEEHARLIMDWRNNPETLRMAFHTEPKKWDSFFPEFLNEYFSLPDLPSLFAVFDGVRIAFIRFRSYLSSSKACEISVNVAPEMRGKKMGTEILKQIQPWIKFQGYDEVFAEIKPDNQASLKAFSQAGFIFLREKIKDIEGEKIPFHLYSVQLNENKKKPVFIIAEAGSNWRMGTPERDLMMAYKLIEIAAESGADAIKFQTFQPEKIYAPHAGQSKYLAEAGYEKDIKEIFEDLKMPHQMLPKLAEHSKKFSIEFMSTPFSIEDFNAVDPFVKHHKIASYELNHLRLIELAAGSQKPVFLSTGASNEEEIQWAVQTYKELGGQNLTLLQCTAKYPADLSEMNLRSIPFLQKRFKLPVGLSDHSRDPLVAPLAAVALGATVIEKHFTLNNDLPGPDHRFAIIPNELRLMVKKIREVEVSLGTESKTVLEAELELRNYARRGIQALRDIEEGEVFKEGRNIDILRPGQQRLGAHSKCISQIEGKKAKRRIKSGEGIQLNDA